LVVAGSFAVGGYGGDREEALIIKQNAYFKTIKELYMHISESKQEAWLPEVTTVGEVLAKICHHPCEYLLHCWNWKTAFLSALVRAALFFAVNIAAGFMAALVAMLGEFAVRIVGAGFYGGVIESFRLAKPRWLATLIVLIALPCLNHSAELFLHWILGSPNIKASMIASIALTVISTSFNLFAMRKEVFITGQNCKSLYGDLREMPRLLLEYCRLAFQLSWKSILFLCDLIRYGKAISPFSSGQAAGRTA
jgi:hypothetical protein